MAIVAGSGALLHSFSEPLPTEQKLSLFQVALPPPRGANAATK